MLKTFTIYPEKDSVRTAFNHGQRATVARLTLERRLAAFPEYLLKQDDIPVAIIRGKEIICGGEHFAVIPLLPADWEQQQAYWHLSNNVPYWDGEQRLRSLDVLLFNLSTGLRIHEALDDAVSAQDEDDEFFAGIPEVAYTGQQPEDLLLPEPIEWEPEPEATPPAGMTPDECLAPKQPSQAPTKIYPWTFWYRGEGGASHQVILEATYEDAQRAWDELDAVFGLTSRRP